MDKTSQGDKQRFLRRGMYNGLFLESNVALSITVHHADAPTSVLVLCSSGGSVY